MAEAIFRHGDPSFADYTPAAGDVAAGQVVLIGNTAGLTAGIAHLTIPNGSLGALAVGGGIYDVVAAGNYAAGSKVWWDDAANKVTTTSTNNAQFGYTVETAPAANATIEVLHVPYA
jgi:hypothetical protein